MNTLILLQDMTNISVEKKKKFRKQKSSEMSTSESAKMIQQQGRIKTFEITRKLPQPYEVPRFTKNCQKIDEKNPNN